MFLAIRFFYSDIYLAQELDKTFELYSNEVHDSKRPWRAFEFEKKTIKIYIMGWKN